MSAEVSFTTPHRLIRLTLTARRSLLCVTLYLSACGASPDEPLATPEGQQSLRVELAELLVKSQAYDEAAPILKAALERDPQDARIHYLLGVTLRDKGVYSEAELSLRRALSFNPTFAEAYSALGVLMSLMSQHEQAVAQHREAIKLRDDKPKFYNNLAFSLALLNRHQEAIEAYERALRLAPTERRLYVNLAFSLGALKRDEEARRMLSQALTPGEVWSNLALIYMTRGEKKEARRAYREALKLNPRLDQAREALARLDRGEVPEPKAEPKVEE